MAGPGAPGGFDFNQWQQMQQSQQSGPGEADSPDTITKDGVEKAAQTAIKVGAAIVGLAINGELKNQTAVRGEVNVGGGLSLQHGAIVKDKQGVLAQILKYFTRDIPNLLAGTEGGDGGGGGNHGGGSGGDSGGDHGGSSSGALASNDHSMGGGGHAMPDMPEMRECGGKLMASDPINVAMSKLGELSLTSTPNEGRNGLDAGFSV